MEAMVLRPLLSMRIFVSLAISKGSLQTWGKCAINLSVLLEELVNIAACQLAASFRAGGLFGDEGGLSTMYRFGFEYDLESSMLASTCHRRLRVLPPELLVVRLRPGYVLQHTL